MTEWEMEMASKQEEAERASALLSASKNAIPDTNLSPEQFKETECEDCGNDLDYFRMQKGLTRCVPCLSKKEHRDKLFMVRKP